MNFVSIDYTDVCIKVFLLCLPFFSAPPSISFAVDSGDSASGGTVLLQVHLFFPISTYVIHPLHAWSFRTFFFTLFFFLSLSSSVFRFPTSALEIPPSSLGRSMTSILHLTSPTLFLRFKHSESHWVHLIRRLRRINPCSLTIICFLHFISTLLDNED